MMNRAYSFSATLWEQGGEVSWVFLTVPIEESDEIAELAVSQPGFGSVRVSVRIGSTRWATSLFPSKRLAAYVLPVKRAVRTAESLELGDEVAVSLEVVTD